MAIGITAGWTTFTPSPDTLIHYVNLATGNDATGQPYLPSAPEVGSDPFHPIGSILAYRTATHVKTLLRNNMPDWMLLHRGETREVSLGEWSKSGRAAGEPMLIATYYQGLPPTGRCKFLTGSSLALTTPANGTPVNYLAIVGLHFEPHTRPNANGPEGIDWYAPTEGLLIEDCYFSGYTGNIVFDQYPGANGIKNVKIRRSVIVDAFDTVANAQGMYADDVDGLLIEQNLFDHNGWKEGLPGAGSDFLSHNVYLQNGSQNVTVRGNIISQGSNHGLQARRGGLVTDNLFVRNVVAMLVGGGDSPTPGGVNASVVNNVILEGYGAQHFPGGGGWGVDLKNVASALVQNNILANNLAAALNAFSIGSYVSGGPEGVGVDNTVVKDNIIYNWRGPIKLPSAGGTGLQIQNNFIQDPNPLTGLPLINCVSVSPSAVTFLGNTYHSARPAAVWFQVAESYHDFGWWLSNAEASATQQLVAYPDPGRTTGSYAATQGLEATHAAFIAECRKQSKVFWRPQFTASAVNIYIRAGLGKGGLASAASGPVRRRLDRLEPPT